MRQRSVVGATLLMVCVCAGGLLLRETSFAQKASVPREPDMAAIATENIRELLALMDTDKNGKISKQEWMKFMETTFDRLDAKKKGEIDPRELLRPTASLVHARSSDLGK